MTLDLLVGAFAESLRGEREWRNVQGVLLTSFRSVAEILAAQTQRLAAMEEQIQSNGRQARAVEVSAAAAQTAANEAESSVAKVAKRAAQQALADAQAKWRRSDDQRIGEQVQPVIFIVVAVELVWKLPAAIRLPALPPSDSQTNRVHGAVRWNSASTKRCGKLAIQGILDT